MQIEVLQSDIDHGERHCCERCPVARAIERALGRDTHSPNIRVSVFGIEGAEIVIFRSGEWGLWVRWVSLPPEVVTFVNRFDVGLKVAPFTFELAYEPEVAAV